MTLLEVKNLTVEFVSRGAPFRAVDSVSFRVAPGEVLGVVGESGSGKSLSSLAIMGLIGYPGHVAADSLLFGGRDVLALSPHERRGVSGGGMAMVFQDPMSALNPCLTVGFQIMETLKVQGVGTSKRQRRERALDLLDGVGITDPRSRMTAYPHQLSGGMCQRVMIAMAVACGPRLLIADEPTTALDTTVQARIVDLLLKLRDEEDMALILVTHDLALASQVADRIQIMYAGQLFESGPIDSVFATPRHPYTQALLGALPEFSEGCSRLRAIPGIVPGRYDRPNGCLLAPRCRYANSVCIAECPELKISGGQEVRCFHPLDNLGQPTGLRAAGVAP